MKNIKAVLFDLDGTILNTLDDLYLSVNHALEIHHYPKRTKEEIRKFLGNGVKVLIENALPDNNKEKLEEVINTFKEYYQQHSMDNISKYEGIDELITKLKAKNIKIAVVTNKFDLAAKAITKKFFQDRVDITIGESPALNKKPHPDMCNKALEFLNVKAENTIYLGDSEVDLKTAQNASLFGVICTWGFRTKEELINIGAKHLIDQPIELLKYLE